MTTTRRVGTARWRLHWAVGAGLSTLAALWMPVAHAAEPEAEGRVPTTQPAMTGDAGPAAASFALAAQAARILSRAIQIPTVNPPGNEAQLASYLVGELRAFGIDSRIIFTPSSRGPQSRNRAAAWARVRGRGEARPLVLLSHLDTVPADPREWQHDPFGGVIEDGLVHGRGALDAKGVTVIHLLTLVELSRREIPLNRDVIFLATPDEESGGIHGAGFLAREHSDLLDDAEYLLTEGGGILVERNSGLSVWGVGITEKSPCWLRVSAAGTPGHSSAPDREAAVPRLIAALERVRHVETPLHVVPEVARMFETLSPRAAEEDRAGYRDLRAALAHDPAFRSRFLANRGRDSLVRDTLSITMLEGGPRINVAPSQARAAIDVRLLPGASCEEFRREIEAVVDDPEVSVAIELHFESQSSPIDTDLYRSIERVARLNDPSALVVPRMVGGFTDSHWFRENGIVAYGFVPRWLVAKEARGVHGIDESVSIENLERGVQIMVQLLEELSEMQDGG